MKPDPIYIEVSDEITTVIERLKAAEGKQVALVIPKGAILLQSIVNLKLAKRAAAEAGKDLLLVTTDKIGRNLAEQIGIAHVSRIDEAGKAEVPAEEAGDGSEPHVIAGVKIHRYYEDKDDEETEASTEAPIAPIVPKELYKESAIEEEPPATPIVVRQLDIHTTPKSEPAPLPVPELEPAVELIEPQAEPPKEVAVAEAKKEDPQPKPKRKILSFLGYLLILVILAAVGLSAFYLPQTEVTLHLTEAPFSKDVTVKAAVDTPPTDDPSNDTVGIVAEWVSGVASDSSTGAASGSKEVGDPAKGTALLYNGSSTLPQTVAAGTIIAVGALTFTTDSEVTVPIAKVENFISTPGSASVPITATVSGTDSNLSASTCTLSPDNSALRCQITSTAGGTSKTVKVVTESDIANTKLALTKKLQDAATQKLTDSIKERDLLFDAKTDAFTEDGITISVPAGTQADTVQVSGKGTLKRLVVDKTKVTQAAQVLLQASQDSSHTLIISSITASSSTFDVSSGTASVKASAIGTLTGTVDAAAVRQQLVGKNQQSGLTILSNVPNTSKAEVVWKPAWWPIKNFPFSTKFIKVTVTHG